MSNEKDYVKARHSLIDPLVEPDPSDETGLNSHFRSTFAPRQGPPSPPESAGLKDRVSSIPSQHTGTSVETNPYRRSRASSVSKGPSVNAAQKYDYPSPPNSASPRRQRFSGHKPEDAAIASQGRPRRSSQPGPAPVASKETGLARGNSLRARYPGDKSHRPLDQIRDDTQHAHRAHHLRRKNFQGADVIDRLDRTTFSYHHEGPYDAASLARNLSYTHSPIAAVADTNEEALKATPRENIVDAVTKHRPLDGTAVVPPGMPDKFGRVLHYEEGADLMREPGADYKRWGGVTYLPEDLKGKGEPWYSMDEAEKKKREIGTEGTEMKSAGHRRHVSLTGSDPKRHDDNAMPSEGLLGRSNTTGKSPIDGLKKRFGSLRRKNVEA